MGMPPRQPANEPPHTYEVEWTTITYRTIAFYAFLGLVVVGFIIYLISPNYVTQKLKQGLAVISGRVGQNLATDTAASRREAHFVNLDGTVRIKKARSLQWINADYGTSLEKGDFVQTASDGVARIIFADGTNYVLKPDSLIIVEESREDPVTKATKVAVQVNSGAVDLSTGRFEIPGSSSQVSFADAVANLAGESRAALRNDPDKNIHEFTVNQGEVDVTRGSTSVRLGQYDQVTFRAGQAGLVRLKVIAPPRLVSPQNMELKLAKDPKSATINFAWTPVAAAVSYHLMVSPTVMLSNFIVDRKVVGRTSYEASGLDEGTYYWIVTSIDAKGVESQPSDANRLNLVQDVGTGTQAYLEVTNIIQHGKVVEVQGKTEPGSTVIINNEQVFSIAPDGTFRHFTSPLPKSGVNQITITAQDRRGNSKTIRKTVVIE